MAKKKIDNYGLGRRKAAVARVILQPGNSKKTVNGKELEDYFTTIQARKSALEPLTITSQVDETGFIALVNGGGMRAQAEAIKLATARALLQINGDWRKQLKEAGTLTRDPRVKERKKFGLKRARRAPQFSKR